VPEIRSIAAGKIMVNTSARLVGGPKRARRRRGGRCFEALRESDACRDACTRPVHEFDLDERSVDVVKRGNSLLRLRMHRREVAPSGAGTKPLSMVGMGHASVPVWLEPSESRSGDRVRRLPIDCLPSDEEDSRGGAKRACTRWRGGRTSYRGD